MNAAVTWYRIGNLKTIEFPKVLAIQAPRTVAGAKAIQWTWSGQQDQMWHLQPVGNNAWAIRNASHPDWYALSVQGNSSDNGANIVQWHFNANNEHAMWWAFANTNGTVWFQNVATRKCLAIAGGGSTATGAEAVQWTCGQGADQKWWTEAVLG